MGEKIMVSHSIGYLIFEDIELLDMSGPQTAFYEANSFVDKTNVYTQFTIGFDANPVKTEAGTRIMPDKMVDEVKHLDTLIIPGGCGARAHFTEAQLSQLAKLILKAGRVVSICTGVFLMAKVGLPSRATVTTHWNFAGVLQQTFPELNVQQDRIYTQYEKFWSSAGVTAGIDLALRLIELDHDSVIAANVARNLVVYLKRNGSQKQFSQLLALQSSTSDVLQPLYLWLVDNLDKKVSVEDIAGQLSMSERQTYRYIKANTGESPANYVEKVRLNYASEMLTNSAVQAKQVAYDVGYQTYDGFRKAFERHFGMTPIMYRAHFGANEG